MQANLDKAKVFTDFSGFEALRKGAREQDPKAVKEVSKQFESIFTYMMLKSMRSAGQFFSKDGFFQSDTMQHYQAMFDQQIAVNLSQGQGLGLAKVLEQQLSNTVPGQKQQTPTEMTPQQLVNNMSQQLSAKMKHVDQMAQVLSEAKQQADKMPATLQPPTVIDPSTRAAIKTEFESPIEFVKSLLPEAKKVAESLGVDPKLLIAQAALETAWGKSIIKNKKGESSFNLFNIKATKSWNKGAIHVTTTEYENGKAIKTQAPFRKYDTYAESFTDYFKLLIDSPRYQNALDKVNSPKAYLDELQKAGYATDPNYADKIHKIYKSEIMSAVEF